MPMRIRSPMPLFAGGFTSGIGILRQLAAAGFVGNHLAIAHGDLAVARLGQNRIVRNHDDGVALVVEVVQHLHDLTAGGGVEVAGGLVGKDNVRLVDQCPGDGDALALTAGKLGRLMFEPVAETELGGIFARRFDLGLAVDTGIDQRHGDILDDGQLREQVKLLKDESDAVVAQVGQGLVIEVGGFDIVDQEAAVGGIVETAEHVHEG